MNGLFLCGYGCKPWIWEKIREIYSNDENNIKFIEWPMDSTNGFNSITEFSTWVRDNFINEDEQYDFIVGHSMGGLIALELSTMKNINVKHIVLIESYIKSPMEFFQNILMENTSELIKEKVLAMLKQESKYYSSELRNQLRDLDLTELINKSNSSIHCIYGDRGVNNKDRVLNELGLPATIQNHMDIKIIQNSCHFPMIENSKDLIDALKTILESSD